MNFADWLDRKDKDFSFESWLMARTVSDKKRPYVFISYAHNDATILSEIVKELDKSGVPFWFDSSDLRKVPDKNFDEQINEGIYYSFCFISFISKNYWTSKYCPHELEIALRNRFEANPVQDEYIFRRYHEHILIVDLDGWNETTPDKVRLLRQVNQPSIINFKKNYSSDTKSIVKKIVEDLLQSYLIEWIIHVNKTGDFSYEPEIPDFFKKLKIVNEENFYESEKIYPELFPKVKKVNSGEETIREISTNDNLLSYLQKIKNSNNIFIYGEGGGGKTIVLQEFSKYLTENNIFAVYINVNNLRFNEEADPLLSYLQQRVCGIEWWNVMQIYMQAMPNGNNSVVLLLDGINEIPVKNRRNFIQNCINKFPYRNVKFVLTSRFDFSRELSSRLNFIVLETIMLDNDTVEIYLKNHNLLVTEDIKNILKTPMLLTIFTNTEESSRVNSYIPLNKIPSSRGQILENFFSFQIYDKNGNVEENSVLFEYFLPEIAFHMLKNDSMIISLKDFWSYLKEIKNDGEHFERYKSLRLFPGSFQQTTAEDILPALAEKKFHILKRTSKEHVIGKNFYYEFTHQMWRDFFVACKIIFEMSMIDPIFSNSDKISQMNDTLEIIPFPDEVLSLVSDLSREETRKPFQKEMWGDWIYPSKTSSDKFPSAERILDLWREKKGERAQNAVYNILNIIKFGRSNNLSNLNLSKIDLRLCKMNGCKFVEFWRNKIYPSVFDESWLDLSFFINDGHSSKITALCTDGKNLIFSGDSSGDIRCFDISSGDWIINENFSVGDAVVDLAWDNNSEILAILYQNMLIIYATNIISVKKYPNTHRNKRYRYVRFSNSGEVEVSFNIAPLLFFSIETEKLIPCDMTFDVPARCAVWNPKLKQIVRSYLLRLIEVDYFDTENNHWSRHPVLRQKIQNMYDNLTDSQKKSFKLINHEPTGYIKLQDYGIDSRDLRTECICFNNDGNKFLIAAGYSLLEFNSIDLKILQLKKFQSKIGACCYGSNNRIFVGMGNSLNILDAEFNEILSIKGSKISSIKLILRAPNENFYYLLSENGEIKQINFNAQVKLIRKIDDVTKFHWIKDKQTNEYELLILPSKKNPDGCRFNFFTNQKQSLGWCYEVLDMLDDFIENKDTVIYDVGENRNEIMLVKKNVIDDEGDNKIIRKNFSGVYIYGCSFRNLCGGSATLHKNFLLDNGAEV